MSKKKNTISETRTKKMESRCPVCNAKAHALSQANIIGALKVLGEADPKIIEDYRTGLICEDALVHEAIEFSDGDRAALTAVREHVYQARLRKAMPVLEELVAFLKSTWIDKIYE